ncbi:hypothetical protein G6M89_01305 [Natronolimnobius sp. AArcel1]|uniref:hypothetical protein n=1 Tax=Natronolimnobius sp. AArcel1 TaxID=1679093 RepID=UPI0013EA2989|nr:hypothetical protein [Natronolimnobius sp. AArcel1]NGM67657.1 hypothetical protein [Natronolimnobius sp. AArcel1]
MQLGPIPHEVVLLAYIGAFVFTAACFCYAIAADANARGASGDNWALFAFVLAPIAAPAYLLYRQRLPSRDESGGSLEQWAGAVGIGGLVTIVFTAMMTPPDPFTSVIVGVPLLVVAIPLVKLLCYEPGWRAAIT